MLDFRSIDAFLDQKQDFKELSVKNHSPKISLLIATFKTGEKCKNSRWRVAKNSKMTWLEPIVSACRDGLTEFLLNFRKIVFWRLPGLEIILNPWSNKRPNSVLWDTIFCGINIITRFKREGKCQIFTQWKSLSTLKIFQKNVVPANFYK